MTDLLKDKAAEWDTRPVPAQISAGVMSALIEHVELMPSMRVMDFGAGTGLVASKIAPHVARILAVDVSEAMLEQLAKKPELEGKVDIRCHNILERPLDDAPVDLVVSAMAMHHVEDTGALFDVLREQLVDGGTVAIADLDAEDGQFHPPDTEGVFHHGFDREALGKLVAEHGFVDVSFETACEVHRDEKAYPIFLMTAKKG